MIENLKFLREGDAIGIYSPSAPATYTASKRTQRGISFLESKGFKIKLGKLSGKKDYYRSGSIKERSQELNELINDPEIKCIMSSIGGYNSNSLLPYIDYEAFKLNPKMIIGYSDVTAILLAIYAKTGISTFYGSALVPSFGEFQPLVEENWKYFKEICMNNHESSYEYIIPEKWTDEFINWEEYDRPKKLYNNIWKTEIEGNCVGRLIGGNLNTMMGIWGTEYMPEIKVGDILYIEDTMENPMILERSFALLKNSGIFNKISGIILGKHEQYDDLDTNRRPADILLEILGNEEIPFLSEFDSCHTHPIMPLVIGGIYKLDATNRTVTWIVNSNDL